MSKLDQTEKVVREVADERRRQITAEGWTPEKDDVQRRSELAIAAACYALPPLFRRVVTAEGKLTIRQRLWPWAGDWWKPTTRRRDLVKAGALILAEIERIDRAEAAKANPKI